MVYLLSDYSVALCRRLGFDRFNRSRVRIYFVIVFYTRFGLLAHVSLAEVICFSNFFLKNSTDAFKIPTVEVEGYKNFNYSTLRDLRETIESAFCTVWTLLQNQKNQSFFSNICQLYTRQLPP